MVREIGKERKEKNRRNGEEKKTEMEKKRNGENSHRSFDCTHLPIPVKVR